ncbi:T9SS type A sorting domain-containing protein [Chryseobacterium limigenitum]|uniref:Delta-60 repeat domain-containing protein/Por secretion system C-terminal sorting domain-containing protein n=1 Tax=Chryseobacterium limigenitum TaxID=1612149 RepID=A0A1K2IPK1_9FLAO|nr:T9SS type A sorting domain-containing protein [Chryseobacterium limigenitum]SFZ94186.1 delta-60 repeat domain-containing protein/Por secretion system C-terminal sorting domain-containing protein [Chryseobacterium limigenitum]
MTKNLFLVLLLAVQTAFGQIISKDFSFGSGGVSNVANYTFAWTMTQDSDGNIYSSYSIPNSTETFVYKLTANGVLDSTFGNNGKIQLPYYTYQCQLKMQPDGKLVVFGYGNTNGGVSGSISVGIVYRILPNGQPDTTFGTNGISTTPNGVGGDVNGRSVGLILQNGKIIVYDASTIYRFNADGSIDTSFGNNGSVATQGNFYYGALVLLDNQSNLVCITKINSAYANGIIKKFNPDGQAVTSFGNNGILQSDLIFEPLGTAIIDSNNKIVISKSNSTGNEIFRLNPDGTLDNTFNCALSTIYPNALAKSIIEKDGYYYIGGNQSSHPYIPYSSDESPTFFTKLTQSGSIAPDFGYYPDSSFVSVEEMVVNNNSIISNGNAAIVKYLLNTTTLSTAEATKTSIDISFENPVKQNLIYKSKEKVSKIEIYSVDGKIVKTLKDNNTGVSELLKGIYFAKINFENGKTVVKKLMKN